MSLAVDPITVSVVQHRLRAIVEEMGEAMLRTSYSQILNSSRDFSTALCDPEGRLIAQAEHVPIHVGALPGRPGRCMSSSGHDPSGRRLPAQRSVSRRQPPARPHRLRAGVRRRPAGLLVDQPLAPERHRRRHPRRLQPGATEIWQEGIRIPPLQLYEQGMLRDDVSRCSCSTCAIRAISAAISPR